MAEFPLLDQLCDERIFSIKKLDNGNFEIAEECDEYFRVVFDKSQMMALVVEIASFINAGGEL